MTVQGLPPLVAAVREQVGRVMFGSDELTRLALVAFMVKGHLLLEGSPGTGKTLFAKLFARVMGLSLKRIQCTPDLMPGDVLGANIFDFRSQTFALTRGPVFTECLLADEINRTPPKTQSALLEAMQERTVTIDGTTHSLPARFTVMATQNPIEHEGTYPLPEAQLDRFLFKVDVGYPGESEEVRAVLLHGSSSAMPDLESLGVQPVLEPAWLDALREVPSRIRFDESVAKYTVSLARATRQHPALSVGLSPRAASMIGAAARAAAACEGRDFTVPDDVKSLFIHAAHHRVLLAPAAEMEDVRIPAVLGEILRQVPVPR